MTLQAEFIPLQLEQLRREAAIMKADGWRFIQTHAVNTDDGVDLYYSFMKDGRVVNYRIESVKKDQPVPSITDLFLAAFVFENEARELFGVDMRDIAIDFGGAMYAPAQNEPMTFLSPEQKALRDKAKKAAAAKAAKDAGGADAKAPASKGGFVMTPERQARLDAKLATMSPEKVAKVEAALKARAAEAAQGAGEKAQEQQPTQAATTSSEKAAGNGKPESEAPQKRDGDLEAKLASMDPEKAAKVRAALEGKPVEAALPVQPASEGAAQAGFADEQVSNLIGLMDDAKASIVRKALNMKGGE